MRMIIAVIAVLCHCCDIIHQKIIVRRLQMMNHFQLIAGDPLPLGVGAVNVGLDIFECVSHDASNEQCGNR